MAADDYHRMNPLELPEITHYIAELCDKETYRALLALPSFARGAMCEADTHKWKVLFKCVKIVRNVKMRLCGSMRHILVAWIQNEKMYSPLINGIRKAAIKTECGLKLWFAHDKMQSYLVDGIYQPAYVDDELRLWYLEGRMHSFEKNGVRQPAYVSEHSYAWYDNGELQSYLLDGWYMPAIVHLSGTAVWCKNGKSHSFDNNPAVISGDVHEWHKEGVLQSFLRDGKYKPAVRGPGYKYWYSEDKLHSFTNADGSRTPGRKIGDVVLYYHEGYLSGFFD